MKIHYPNLITIYGDARNIGKTTLACQLIERLSKEKKPVGIKISPHFHSLSISQKQILSTEHCQIIEEIDSKE